MTDKELLEFAAKAISGIFQHASSPVFWDISDDENHVIWNPLDDDGAALRLAVKLRLRVCCPTTDNDCALASNGDVTAYSEDDLNDTPMTDLYTATRRAIVKAAAEIGKAMP